MIEFAALDEHQHLFLESISEPTPNTLVLRVAPGLRIPAADLRSAFPGDAIVPSESQYELRFDQYIGYAIRAERWTGPDWKERFQGHLARVYTSSAFLAFLQSGRETPDPGSTHYELICEWHIVDVVATKPPTIVRVP